MMYFIIYEHSKGINATLKGMVLKRDLQLSLINVYQLFKLPTEDNFTPHRQDELAILNLMKNPKKFYFLDVFTC